MDDDEDENGLNEFFANNNDDDDDDGIHGSDSGKLDEDDIAIDDYFVASKDFENDSSSMSDFPVDGNLQLPKNMNISSAAPDEMALELAKYLW